MSTRITSYFIPVVFLGLLIAGCIKPNDTPSAPPLTLPTVITSTATLVNLSTCISGGTVLNNGGDSVTERGICFNTSPTPTTSNNKIISGTGNGVFISTITDLAPNSSYYIRAYAKNSVGTAYGNETQVQTQRIDSAKYIFIGGLNQLYCFNAKNGTLLWSKVLGTGTSFSTPCYSKGMVYAMGYQSILYAFDTTGVLKWSASTGSSTHELSSPVVLNDIVFIKSNNSLSAFNAATGTLKWKFVPPYTNYLLGSLSLANNTIFANYGGITAFNPDNGSIIWTSYCQNRNTTPRIVNNKIFGVFDYQLNIADANNGNLLLSTGYISTANPLAVNAAYGNVYLYKEDGLRVYDELTASLKWSKPGSAVYYAFLGGGAAPVIKDSLVHLVSGGKVVVYNAITGVQVSTYGTNIIDANITVVNNFSYYGNRDVFNTGMGHMYATKILPGGTVGTGGWVSTAVGDFTTTPCVVTDADKMYRAGDDN